MTDDHGDERVQAMLHEVFDAVAQRTTVGPNHEHHPETATSRASHGAAAPAGWGRDSTEPRSGILVFIGAAATVALLMAVVIINAHRDNSEINTIGTGPSPAGAGEYPASPVQTGWQTADFGDTRLSVPGDWTVLRQPDRGSGRGCPDAKPTLVLGGAGSGPCPTTPTPLRLVSLVRFIGDCDANVCGEKSSSGVIRPDLQVASVETLNGVRVASIGSYGGDFCDTCLSFVAPDLGVMGHFTRIDEATAKAVLNTVDRSARWRALHDGPLADTTNWQTIDAAPGAPTKVSVPGGWPVQRVAESPALPIPWQCTDGFADANARSVVIDERPSTMPAARCADPESGAPVDAVYLRPSLRDVYDLSQGQSTTSNGVTITVLDDIYPGASTIEVRIELPGAPSVRLSIGVGEDPVVARTILRNLGRPLPPAIAGTPTSTIGTTVDTATQANNVAPRWSTGICRETPPATGEPVANFPWTQLPTGFTLQQAGVTCGVLDEEMIFDEWTYAQPTTIPSERQHRRVRLTRVELRNQASTATSGANPTETVSVNGKPAKFLNPPPSGYTGLIQLDWEQDANGGAIVVTEGLTRDEVMAIAESFDRGVADQGPRNATAMLTRDDALTKARRITSTLPKFDRVEAKLTTWGSISGLTALSTNKPGGVNAANEVWVIAGRGSGLPASGFGQPGDRWGVVVLDAHTGEILAIATGGAADGSDWPAFFAAMTDDAAGR